MAIISSISPMLTTRLSSRVPLARVNLHCCWSGAREWHAALQLASMNRPLVLMPPTVAGIRFCIGSNRARVTKDCLRKTDRQRAIQLSFDLGNAV